MNVRKSALFSAILISAINFASANLVINEVFPNPIGSETGNEQVEIYNPGPFATPLNNLIIQEASNPSTSPSFKTFATLSGTLEPGEFLVVNGSNLNNLGDIVRIFDNSNNLVIDKVAYGNANDGNFLDNAPEPDEGDSIGRLPDGKDTDMDNEDFFKMEPSMGKGNIFSGKAEVTLQSIIDRADPFSIVKVGSGIYEENLVIGKSISLIGASLPKISPSAGNAITINSGDVNIQSFEINAGNGIGILINGGNVVVKGSKITGNEIGIEVSAGNLIANFNNIFGNSAFGVENLLNTEFNVERNWWGCRTGPGTSDCDKTSGNLDSEPFLKSRIFDFESFDFVGGDTATSKDESIKVKSTSTGEAFPFPGILTFFKYETNPQAQSSVFFIESKFFDIFFEILPNNLNNTEIEFCDIVGDRIFWWNGLLWLPASNQERFVREDGASCIRILVNDETSPSLSDLSGTAFGSGSVPIQVPASSLQSIFLLILGIMFAAHITLERYQGRAIS